MSLLAMPYIKPTYGRGPTPPHPSLSVLMCLSRQMTLFADIRVACLEPEGLFWCRSVRTRRFQSLSTQDLCQFLIVGVLSGLFWLQRAKSSTTAAASDTLGMQARSHDMCIHIRVLL